MGRLERLIDTLLSSIGSKVKVWQNLIILVPLVAFLCGNVFITVPQNSSRKRFGTATQNAPRSNI